MDSLLIGLAVGAVVAMLWPRRPVGQWSATECNYEPPSPELFDAIAKFNMWQTHQKILAKCHHGHVFANRERKCYECGLTQIDYDNGHRTICPWLAPLYADKESSCQLS